VRSAQRKRQARLRVVLSAGEGDCNKGQEGAGMGYRRCGSRQAPHSGGCHSIEPQPMETSWPTGDTWSAARSPCVPPNGRELHSADLHRGPLLSRVTRSQLLRSRDSGRPWKYVGSANRHGASVTFLPGGAQGALRKTASVEIAPSSLPRERPSTAGRRTNLRTLPLERRGSGAPWGSVGPILRASANDSCYEPCWPDPPRRIPCAR
jgi:hypothetical protein